MRTESMGSYLQAVKEQKLAVNIGMLSGGGTMRAQAAGFGVQRLEDAHYRRIHAAIEQMDGSERARIEQRASRLSVRLLLPMGLCLLPAFLLIAVVPTIMSFMRM